MRTLAKIAFALPLAFAVTNSPLAAQSVKPVHGIAMHGSPKYGPDFKHFEYTNPSAPKGGNLRMSAIGTFDSFNPYILKGDPAIGIGFVFESLMTSSADEAFSEYGLLAETIEMPADRSWVAFNLRAGARWHDGKPVTVDDVIFSLTTLKTKGRPIYRFYYGNVVKAEKTGPRRVKFTFSDSVNRELPLIVGQLPILPKHFFEGRDFTKTILEPIPGSGPYRIAKFESGRSVTYERVRDYWGRDLPVNKGRYNADQIRYDYYRDQTVALEAFKAGEYDFRQENSSKVWATGYEAPARRAGLFKTEMVENEIPTGMQAFVFNTRKELFKDRRVRRALAFAFDFEWTNKNLFYGQYARTESYFSNSELAATGLPSAAELKLLKPIQASVPAEVLTAAYKAPSTTGKRGVRGNLRSAVKLLKEAGWVVKDRKLVNAKTGKPFSFEILLRTGSGFSRIVLPFQQNLKRLGVDMRLREVETAQYRKRTDDFDFDMIVSGWGQSLSPGNEQRDYWGSAAAGRPGSRNLIGVNNPAIDQLIELVIEAPDRDSLITRTRALDRVLLWNHYVIPNWHLQSFRVAFWDKFGRPAKTPRYGLGFTEWWIDPAREAKLNQKKNLASDRGKSQ